MAEFRFTCKRCEHEILVEDSDCGKRVVCRKCGKCNVVPARLPDAKPLKEKLTYPYVCTSCGSKVSEREKRVYIRQGGFGAGIWFILPGLTIILILRSLVSFISEATRSTFIVAIIIGVPVAILCVSEGIYRSIKGDSTRCPVCGNFNSLIPSASPRGRQLIRDMNCICSDDKE